MTLKSFCASMLLVLLAGIGSSETTDGVSTLPAPIVLHGMPRRPRSDSEAKRFDDPAAATMRAKRWLKMVQNEDGSWPGLKTASTALAVYTLLRFGDLPAADTEFGPVVEKGIAWLVDHQQADGTWSDQSPGRFEQPLAAMALGEAFALTGDPSIRHATIRASDSIFRSQLPCGAWSRDLSTNGIPELEFTAWASCALATIWNAGCRVPEITNAWKRIPDAVRRFADPDGGFGTTNRAASGLSAAGALLLQSAHQSDSVEAAATMNRLAAARFGWDCHDGNQPYAVASGDERPILFWFFMMDAAFESGGRVFSDWNGQFLHEFSKRQIRLPAAMADWKGTMRDVGYWDSPSRDEIGGYCDDGTHSLPCLRWIDETETPGTTSLGQRVQDTCLTMIPETVNFHFRNGNYYNLDAELGLSYPKKAADESSFPPPPMSTNGWPTLHPKAAHKRRPL